MVVNFLTFFGGIRDLDHAVSRKSRFSSAIRPDQNNGRGIVLPNLIAPGYHLVAVPQNIQIARA